MITTTYMCTVWQGVRRWSWERLRHVVESAIARNGQSGHRTPAHGVSRRLPVPRHDAQLRALAILDPQPPTPWLTVTRASCFPVHRRHGLPPRVAGLHKLDHAHTCGIQNRVYARNVAEHARGPQHPARRRAYDALGDVRYARRQRSVLQHLRVRRIHVRRARREPPTARHRRSRARDADVCAHRRATGHLPRLASLAVVTSAPWHATSSRSGVGACGCVCVSDAEVRERQERQRFAGRPRVGRAHARAGAQERELRKARKAQEPARVGRLAERHGCAQARGVREDGAKRRGRDVGAHGADQCELAHSGAESQRARTAGPSYGAARRCRCTGLV
jgi:hypothetical protein